MEDTQVGNDTWKPGKAGIMGNLNSVSVEFLRDAFRDIATAYKEGDTPEEVLDILETEYEFERIPATDSRGRTYDNACKQIAKDGSNIVRVSATLSGGRLSWQVKEFWR